MKTVKQIEPSVVSGQLSASSAVRNSLVPEAQQEISQTRSVWLISYCRSATLAKLAIARG